MLRENIFIVLRAPVPRVAHSLALVVGLKSLLVVSCVCGQRGRVERDSAILSPMVCENCFVLLCSKFPLHNAFAKGPFAAIGRGQGQSVPWRCCFLCLICTFISVLSNLLLCVPLYRTADATQSDY